MHAWHLLCLNVNNCCFAIIICNMKWILNGILIRTFPTFNSNRCLLHLSKVWKSRRRKWNFFSKITYDKSLRMCYSQWNGSSRIVTWKHQNKNRVARHKFYMRNSWSRGYYGKQVLMVERLWVQSPNLWLVPLLLLFYLTHHNFISFAVFFYFWGL